MKEQLTEAITEAQDLAKKYASKAETFTIAAAEMRGRARALEQTLALLEAQDGQEDSATETSEETE
jgi:hypothetical protein